MLDEQHQIVAGAGPQSDIIVRRAPIEGDRDGEFAKALSASHETPHGLSKGVGTERETFDPRTVTTRAEGESLVADMIRRKHATGSHAWQPFAEVQDPAIDKLLGHVGPGERGELAIENGAKVVRVSKVA